jgi:hypothetical protein
VVDGGGLENHCGGNSTGGSNPSLSANLAALACRSGTFALIGIETMNADANGASTSVEL